MLPGQLRKETHHCIHVDEVGSAVCTAQEGTAGSISGCADYLVGVLVC